MCVQQDWAIYGGHHPTLRLLAAHQDVDIHGLNLFGCGAAFWAAASGKVETCAYLYALGIDFELVNLAGHTAVHKAAWKGHGKCLEWMIEMSHGPHLGYQLHLAALDGRRACDKARVNGHALVAARLEVLESLFPPRV